MSDNFVLVKFEKTLQIKIQSPHKGEKNEIKYWNREIKLFVIRRNSVRRRMRKANNSGIIIPLLRCISALNTFLPFPRIKP